MNDKDDLDEKIAMDVHIRSMENSFAAGCLFGITITLGLIALGWLLMWLVTNVKI